MRFQHELSACKYLLWSSNKVLLIFGMIWTVSCDYTCRNSDPPKFGGSRFKAWRVGYSRHSFTTWMILPYNDSFQLNCLPQRAFSNETDIFYQQAVFSTWFFKQSGFSFQRTVPSNEFEWIWTSLTQLAEQWFIFSTILFATNTLDSF